MQDKKTIMIVVLIAVAVVFITLFSKTSNPTPGTVPTDQTLSTGTSVNPSSVPPADGSTQTPPQATDAPNTYQ